MNNNDPTREELLAHFSDLKDEAIYEALQEDDDAYTAEAWECLKKVAKSRKIDPNKNPVQETIEPEVLFKCPECGSMISETAPMCACGYTPGSEQEDEIVCQECFTQQKILSNVCIACGKPIAGIV